MPFVSMLVPTVSEMYAHLCLLEHLVELELMEYSALLTQASGSVLIIYPLGLPGTGLVFTRYFFK